MKPEIGDWRFEIEDVRQEKNQESRIKNQEPRCDKLIRVNESASVYDFTYRKSLLVGLSNTFFLLFIIVGLFSCQPNTSEKHKTTQVIIDGTGRIVEVNQHPQTVMALSPSMTELLFELVPKERIVGRTDQCNYPEACLSLPKVQVYPTVNLEKVLKIKPDLIISNSDITPPETAEKLTQLGIPVLLYEINSIEKFYATVVDVAKVLDVMEEGDLLVSDLKFQVSGFKFQVSETAIALISIDPIYVHGKTSFLNEIMEVAGFENVIDSSLGSYPQVSRSLLLKTNPDYLLGYSFEALDSTFFELYPELRALKAYKEKHIYPLDSDLSSRPSPRFVKLIEEINKIKYLGGLKNNK